MIPVTEEFKRHVPDWETHVYGDRIASQYGEGWTDGYEAFERDLAGVLALCRDELLTILNEFPGWSYETESYPDNPETAALRARIAAWLESQA